MSILEKKTLYDPLMELGTHLALSKKVPGAVVGSELSNVTNKVAGVAEWVPHDVLVVNTKEAAAAAGIISILSVVALAVTAHCEKKKAEEEIRREIASEMAAQKAEEQAEGDWNATESQNGPLKTEGSVIHAEDAFGSSEVEYGEV